MARPFVKTGPLLQISVGVSEEAEDAVSALLSQLLDCPASIYHEAETGRITTSVYLDEPSVWSPLQRSRLLAGLRRVEELGLHLGSGKISVRKLRREDWAESWKRHFKPISVGSALLVKPSWSKRRPRHGQRVVVLDPGLSFGTGQHPTTRFCLQQLASARRAEQKQSFLDMGTGSGILAIAAAKLGYRPVAAFDFDADAVRIARRNASRNRVSRRVRFTTEDLSRLPLRPGRRYQVICANLIFDLLITERDRVLARLLPGGTLVLAGILCSQFARVLRAYESAGLKLKARRKENEWESAAFVRK
jgi:ribosomal protein L11 methyltransferase